MKVLLFRYKRYAACFGDFYDLRTFVTEVEGVFWRALLRVKLWFCNIQIISVLQKPKKYRFEQRKKLQIFMKKVRKIFAGYRTFSYLCT